MHYEDEDAKRAFFDAELGGAEFLSISEPVPPEELLSVILGRHATAKMLGGFGIDAITQRRRCLDKAGYFSSELRLQQDVYFFIKLAASCRMVAGNITEPVAVRGVHGEMRSTDTRMMDECRRIRWKLLDKWIANNVSNPQTRRLYKSAYADFKMSDAGKLKAMWELTKSIVAEPKSVIASYGRFDLNCRNVFSNSQIVIKALSGKNRFVGTLKKRML